MFIYWEKASCGFGLVVHNIPLWLPTDHGLGPQLLQCLSNLSPVCRGWLGRLRGLPSGGASSAVRAGHPRKRVLHKLPGRQARSPTASSTICGQAQWGSLCVEPVTFLGGCSCMAIGDARFPRLKLQPISSTFTSKQQNSFK